MQLTVHTIDTAPADSRALLEGIAADLGLIPNMAAAIATSPTLLAAFDGMRRAVGAGKLDPVLRETAGLAVGVAVDNAYGVAFHSTVLGQRGVDDDEIDAMRAGTAPTDQRLAVVYDLAHEVVTERGKVADTTIERAVAAGLSIDEVLEVVAECAFAGLVGTVDNLAGRVALDGFLKARRWR